MDQIGQKSYVALALNKPVFACLILFILVFVAMEIGRRIGRNTGEVPGSSAVNGAIFAILGLFLAFSFSGAASRFDQRRDLVVQEANAIGTAMLRIDLMPAETQPAMRASFKKYVDARIAAYSRFSDADSFRAGLVRANLISQDIWAQAVAAGKRPDATPALNMLMLPALNEMIDLTTTRAAMSLMHPPLAIRYMLIALALVAALLGGIGLGKARQQRLVYEVAFASFMTLTIFITLDLEYPRTGLIRVDNFETAIVNFSRGN